jgi:hypothetical protein
MSSPVVSRGPTPVRRAIAGGLLAAAVVGSMVAVIATDQGRAAAAGPVNTVAALPAAETAGRGATVPFIEHEAENVATTGSIIGPNRTEGTLASEASGRRAVTLTGGQYVEFTLTAPANSIVARVSIPDSSNGTGLDGSLNLSVNGASAGTLPVTSRYGWYYGSYPFTNDPGAGRQHHFYDESRKLLGQTYPAGTKVRLTYGASNIPAYTVDLADFENVAAPASQPANSVSITSYGADPSGAGDSGSAFDQAISAARSSGRTVWIPAGTFTVNRHVIVDNVTVTGAGPWHSVVRGDGVGFYGNYAPNPSSNVRLANFAIIGEVKERNDSAQVNGVGGALSNTTVTNLWIQHTKVGAWMDGPFTNFTFSGNRILDQTADGLNLHNGITNSTVTNNFVRNSGDDGLALWAEQNQESGNAFTFNTVILPILANNIAIYGGRDITVSDNVVADTQTQGGGLHFANRFSAVPVAGTFTVARNTTVRAGVLDPNWQFGVGALWFDGRDGPMTNTINVSALRLIDSSYEAIQFIDSSVTGVHFDGVSIEGAGTFALQLQGTGEASFRNVVASGLGRGGTYNCQGPSAFAIQDLGGNAGWTGTPYCGPWPTPVYGTPTTPPTSPPTGPSQPPVTTTPPPPTNGNLAQGRSTSATSVNGPYGAGNAVDGNAATYWESANNAFPQSLTVDLGTAAALSRVVLKLPSGWEARTETLSVSGSTNNSTWSTLAGSAGVRFDPSAGNTATLTVSGNARWLRVTVSANTGWPAAQLSEVEVYGGTATTSPTPTPTPTPTPSDPVPPTGDLAAGKSATASSYADVYRPANLTDGNAATYWESTNNAFPQWAQVDLGSTQSVKRIVLTLPPVSAWAARTQTLTVSGSTDGSSFSTIVGSAGYRFDPASGNIVTITFAATSRRYLRLTFTGNTGWPAGQLSSFQAYAS